MIRRYLRVSTEEQGESGLGLDAQRSALDNRYRDDDWREYAEETTTRHGIKGQPELLRLLEEMEEGDTLAVAKLDRLTRDLPDFGALLKRAAREGWFIVALDLGVDTSTPTGELVANIMMAVAQWERKMIGQRTREAMAVKKANGELVGRPVEVEPVIEGAIIDWANEGLGPSTIARRLTERKVPAPRGGTAWYPSTVRRILERLER